MTRYLKSNDNLELGNIELKDVSLPLPPTSQLENGKVAQDYSLEMEIYARFMRHLRMVPSERSEMKVLSAIQFTADILDLRDALVSKILVDCGLRAPRKAFPNEYIDYADQSLSRSGWDVGGPKAATLELKKYWDQIGEDKDAAYRYVPVINNEHYTEI